MRLINSDKFLQDMADLYRQAGWDEREVHFSMADLRSNIGMEDTVLIPQREPDTVQVIRCKDCKFSKAYYHGSESNLGMFTYLCTQGLYGTNADDFCSKAERKEE